MAHYYSNNTLQDNGDHDVHEDTCLFVPLIKTNVGIHEICVPAVAKVNIFFPTADGYAACSPLCHTS